MGQVPLTKLARLFAASWDARGMERRSDLVIGTRRLLEHVLEPLDLNFNELAAGRADEPGIVQWHMASLRFELPL